MLDPAVLVVVVAVIVSCCNLFYCTITFVVHAEDNRDRYMLIWAVQILSTFTTPDLPHSLESVNFSNSPSDVAARGGVEAP